jgi:uncharacterized protein (DUF4213/DUF364 family)
MSLQDEFRKMVHALAARFTLPPIAEVFLPAFRRGGQPKDAQFMAIRLEGGATGISFVLLPDGKMEAYAALRPSDFVARDPREFALAFGDADPLREMIGLASINAVCQHAMRASGFLPDSATDSLGLLSVSRGDRIGMVGLFSGMIPTIREAGGELVVIEKDERLIGKFPDLPLTLDPSELRACNKILCTSTTVLNHSLDEILSHCSPGAFIAIIGPTAGYFPDPLFARGVDVVGGRVVKDGALFLKRLAEGKRWGDATERTCFQKATYAGIL